MGDRLFVGGILGLCLLWGTAPLVPPPVGVFLSLFLVGICLTGICLRLLKED